VRQALAISHPAFIAKELKLTVTLEASKHRVFGDMTRLQQIFWNVFQNAAKFSRTGNSVTVRSHNPTENRIVIEVTDIGIGIEPEILPKVFDAFEQGDSTSMRQYSGLGLGLMISRVIVKAHGGSINAESSGRDRGTTLIVDLPTILGNLASSIET
jgi:signal transduction histidine kinase